MRYTGLLAASLLVLSMACSGNSKPVAAADEKKAAPAPAARQSIDAGRAMTYVRDIVAIGPRPSASRGMVKQQEYIKSILKNDQVEEDVFEAQTPKGRFKFKNLIAKFPGTTNDIVILASHYDTNYSLKGYVGANDGASSTGLLLELAHHLRGPRQGPAVWLVFFDGEEAFENWSATDSLYGSRHLADRWQADGTLKRIKAFLLLDMIGDADLSIDQDGNSNARLQELVLRAATALGHQSHFFRRQTAIEDDHIPFARAGVPVIDIIDLDYGRNNSFHHTKDDTLDKLSPRSLQIVGDVVLESLRLLR